MAETVTEIQYTEDELREIDRIVGVVGNSVGVMADQDSREVPERPFEDRATVSRGGDNIGEPDDLDLPMGDFDAISGETMAGEDTITDDDIETLGPDDIIDMSGAPAGVESLDDIPLEEITDITADLSDVKAEGVEEIDDIEDITGLIEEVGGSETGEIDELEGLMSDTGPETDVEPLDIEDLVSEARPEDGPIEDIGIEEEGDVPGDIEPLEDITFDEAETFPDITEPTEEIEIEEKPPEKAKRKAPGRGSSINQLDSLLSDEPESLDFQDLASDQFVGGEMMAAEEDEGVPEIDIDDFEETAGDETSGEEDRTVSIESESADDIPDLADISFNEDSGIQETAELDIPDIDIDEIGFDDDGRGSVSAPDSMTGDSDDDLPDIGEIEDMDIEPVKAGPEPVVTEDYDSFDDDLKDIEVGDIDEDSSPDSLSIEPLDDEVAAVPSAVQDTGARQGLELSDRDLRKLKKSILLYNPGLITAVKDTVVNDRFAADDTEKLVTMIISGKSEDIVRKFLEKKLGRTIEVIDETAVPGRRVLMSRPEYSREGRERQKKLLRATGIFGIAAGATLVLALLGYQFIYKPVMAKRTINEGVSLILRAGDYRQKSDDYNKAEELFSYVEHNYRNDYLYGYNSYGRAYFQKSEYQYSLKKLNGAYGIDHGDIDTLNNLGYFYSRLPQGNFATVKDDIVKWYYSGDREAAGKKQIDVAIDFYRRALVIDKKNITALVGIGNAYFYQGQYVKAKQYYLDILKVDPDSAIGYSGLLNLYIERDSFSLAASLHTEIRSKGLMKELPSPLLAKLASYYIDIKKTETGNIRVDYGVESPRFKDIDDNIYPAVQSVLKDLSEKDPDYPPLQLQYGRFSRMQKNYQVMRRYLDKAVDNSEKKFGSSNYFGALHLLSEYYYLTKDPVHAYEYAARALKAYGNQPEFTREDFYRETENPGKTYSILGNIFYYFFDRVSFRYGDLDEDTGEGEADTLTNYNIAREKYEKALSEGFGSPEVHYNLGRVYYLNRLYTRALDQWLHLYDDFVSSPEIMMSLGNAFYHLGNYEAARGEYLKLISVFERDAEGIRRVLETEEKHIKIFETLSSVYNNIGAVYQLQGNESKSGLSYWKSIDYSKRLNRENQFARVNLARSFNRIKPSEPVLDESIPYSIEIYRESLRK